MTLGTPIALLVHNEDQRPKDYSETDLYPRPSHADYTYLAKYGVKASSGGGRSSARETVGMGCITKVHDYAYNSVFPGRVAAGAIAEKYLSEAHGIEIVAFVSSVGNVRLPSSVSSSGEGEDDDDVAAALTPDFVKLLATVTREEVDRYTTRCPHAATSERMIKVGAKPP